MDRLPHSLAALGSSSSFLISWSNRSSVSRSLSPCVVSLRFRHPSFTPWDEALSEERTAAGWEEWVNDGKWRERGRLTVRAASNWRGWAPPNLHSPIPLATSARFLSLHSFTSRSERGEARAERRTWGGGTVRSLTPLTLVTFPPFPTSLSSSLHPGSFPPVILPFGASRRRVERGKETRGKGTKWEVVSCPGSYSPLPCSYHLCSSDVRSRLTRYLSHLTLTS